jgi:hypothetical protein
MTCSRRPARFRAGLPVATESLLSNTDNRRLRDRLKGADRPGIGSIAAAGSHAEGLRTKTDPRDVQRVCVTRVLALNHSRDGFPRPTHPKAAILRYRLIARLVPAPLDNSIALSARRNSNLSWCRHTSHRWRTVVPALTALGSPHTSGYGGSAYKHERYNNYACEVHPLILV